MRISTLLYRICLFLIFSSKCIAQNPDVVVSTGLNYVTSVSFSPDGSMLASNDMVTRDIKLWDVNSGLEIRTLSSDQYVMNTHFHPDENLVAGSYGDGTIKIWDIGTGKILNSFGGNPIAYDFCLGNSKIILGYNEDNLLKVYHIYSGKEEYSIKIEGSIADLQTHPNGNNIACYINESIIIYDIVSGERLSQIKVIQTESSTEAYENNENIALEFNEGGNLLCLAGVNNAVHVYDVTSEKLTRTLSGHKNGAVEIKFIYESDLLVSSGLNQEEIRIWDVLSGEELLSYVPIPGSASLAISVHPNNKSIAVGGGDVIKITNPRGKIIKSLKGHSTTIVSASTDSSGKYIATTNWNGITNIWDLSQNKIIMSLEGIRSPIISPNGEYLTGESKLHLRIWDIKSGEMVSEIAKNNESGAITFSLDFNDTIIVAGDNSGIIKVWNIKSKNLDHQIKIKDKFVISKVVISPRGDMLACHGANDNIVNIIDLNSGQIIKTFVHDITGKKMTITNINFDSEGQTLAISMWLQGSSIEGLPNTRSLMSLWNTVTWENTTRELNEYVSTSFMCSNGSILTGVATESGSLKIWEAVELKQVCALEGHSSIVFSTNFISPNLLLSAGADSKTMLWDIANCKKIADLISVDQNDYLIIIPDNYYISSKGATGVVSFRLANKIYPFEQFDLKFNRPDIVADKLGFASVELMDAYHKAYQKRLKKLNFTEEMLGDDFHVPETSIINKDELPASTAEMRIKIQINVTDDKFKLDRINVWINDVAIYGTKGIDLRSKNVSALKEELSVELARGSNKIQVSVLNQKGVESLKETIEINYEAPEKKPSLYIVAIGTSKFKDNRFNLTYAAKDANDFVQLFRSQKDIYENVHVKILTDEQVTEVGIKQLRTFLEQAGRDDVVMLFIAGHGILDANYDYYYATHDMDFNNPSTNGIVYEDIEALLDGLKALKKLFFMDTCHSGEVDKDEVEMAQHKETEQGEVVFRSVGVAIKQKEGLGIENVTKLMKELFSDLRRGTGATVISSAGGVEYAMEGDKWNNGLFTYCVLSGLKDRGADLNQDGEVMLSELQSYVRDQVSELSNGMQVPTSRIENISMDYRLW